MTENSSQFEGTTAGAEIDPCAAVRELGNCCRVTTCSPSADQINTACKPGSNREPIPLELRRHLVHTANQSLRGLLRVQRFTSKGADLEVKCPNYGEGTPCSTHGADLEVRCPDYGEGTPCLTEGSRAHTRRRTEEHRGVPRGPRTSQAQRAPARCRTARGSFARLRALQSTRPLGAALTTLARADGAAASSVASLRMDGRWDQGPIRCHFHHPSSKSSNTAVGQDVTMP